MLSVSSITRKDAASPGKGGDRYKGGIEVALWIHGVFVRAFDLSLWIKRVMRGQLSNAI